MNNLNINILKKEQYMTYEKYYEITHNDIKKIVNILKYDNNMRKKHNKYYHDKNLCNKYVFCIKD